MGEVTGFMKYDRELPRRRSVPVRLRDWKEVYEPFGDDKLRTQAARSSIIVVGRYDVAGSASTSSVGASIPERIVRICASV